MAESFHLGCYRLVRKQHVVMEKQVVVRKPHHHLGVLPSGDLHLPQRELWELNMATMYGKCLVPGSAAAACLHHSQAGVEQVPKEPKLAQVAYGGHDSEERRLHWDRKALSEQELVGMKRILQPRHV